MIQKIIKKYIPNPSLLKQKPFFRFLGKFLDHHSLWHINRHSCATGVSIGIFCAMIPMPFQMVLAAFLSIVLRGNVAISVALVWITNPLTMPPIFFVSYKFGQFLLGGKFITSTEFTLHNVFLQLNQIWKPLYLGSVILGILGAVLGNFLVRVWWRCYLVLQWKKRQRLRKK